MSGDRRGLNAPRSMILLDFVKGETRRITQEEAARRMDDQRARGVRVTREGVSPSQERRLLTERLLFWIATRAEIAAFALTKRRRHGC